MKTHRILTQKEHKLLADLKMITSNKGLDNCIKFLKTVLSIKEEGHEALNRSPE